MHTMLRIGFVVPLCACVLALAACGGSGGLTNAQYAAKVSRLCLVAADQIRELHLSNTVDDYRHYAASILLIDGDFLRQLRKLKSPASIAAPAAAYARASAKAAQDDKNAVAAARSGDTAKLHAAIARANHDSLAAWPYAKKIGATGCYIG